MELERIRRDSSANIETVERMRDECERMTAMVARKDLDLATIVRDHPVLDLFTYCGLTCINRR